MIKDMENQEEEKDEEVKIKKGEAVGQAIFQKFLTIDNDQADGIRTGGFGSTDK